MVRKSRVNAWMFGRCHSISLGRGSKKETNERNGSGGQCCTCVERNVVLSVSIDKKHSTKFEERFCMVERFSYELVVCWMVD